MDHREFRAALKDLGWTQAELARRLGVHPKTVGPWASGKGGVPGYATAYLRLVLGMKQLLGD